ncbi:MAG: imidazolonepropionase [Eubacteriales bacterium]|nr:imidazolonepropionase [Eubacteriales bacterium]
MKNKADLLIINGRLATLAGYSAKPQRGSDFGRLGLVDNGAVAITDNKILAAGPMEQVLSKVELSTAKIIDAGGRLVTPGLIDPHTHVVHCGSREMEYGMRLAGTPYIEILKAGGGILNSVRSLRNATAAEMVAQTKKSLRRMLSFGVTTAEAKSGYGLDTESEVRMLQAVQILNQIQPVDLVPTFMGAHAIPEEYKDDSDEFVRIIIEEMLPRVKDLACFCDVFCEDHVFSIRQTRAILQAAREQGLQLKLHADELAPTGGAQLAAEMGAVSADHLLCTDADGIAALAASDTIAVLLPGTSFNLMSRYAPAREMLAAGVAIALSTDYNPGSCPTENLQLIMALGCLKLGLSPSQVLAAVTINAAHAVKGADRIGSLEAGKQADLVIFDADNEAYLPYHFGINHTWMVIKSGRVAYDKRSEEVCYED